MVGSGNLQTKPLSLATPEGLTLTSSRGLNGGASVLCCVAGFRLTTFLTSATSLANRLGLDWASWVLSATTPGAETDAVPPGAPEVGSSKCSLVEGAPMEGGEVSSGRCHETSNG